jgi:hypothetical protein
MEHIEIGGIGGKIHIHHFVEFWMPYKVENNQTRIVFGLAEDLPISVIFGLLFYIGPKEYAVTAEFDAGYWQVLISAQSRGKTGFFTPNGKSHWIHMPMGIKNAAASFVCIVLQMKKEWDATWSDENKASSLTTKTFERYEGGDDRLEQAETLRSAKTGSSVIVDDLIAYAMNVKGLLAYWECILQTLLHYRVTIRLRKARFLPTRAEFVGVDVMALGDSPRHRLR